MIPSNINREHIVKAIRQIDSQGVPPRRKSNTFSLVFNRKPYPPKYVVSLSNVFANGTEHPPSEFNGGDETNSFLSNRGFKIVKKVTQKGAVKPKAPKKITPKKDGKRHDQRCPECKKAIVKMLSKIYGQAESNYRFEASANIEGYRGTSFYDRLKKIFSVLQNHRGHQILVKTKNLPRCDFFVPNPGFIVEFDESQHFTFPRKISLQNYPRNFKAGFSIKRWMALCEEIDAQDNDPPFRDEQRAWYDTIRDFLPLHYGLKPTVRLYAGERRWCSLHPKKPGDVALFKNIIAMKQAKARNWVSTVLIQSDENYTNRERFKIMAQVIDRISKETKGDGVLLFPGGWFSAGKRKARTIYKWVEKNVKDTIGKQKRNLIVCVGIDGRETDEWAKDQIGAAVSKKGIIALGRKFFATDREKKYIESAQDHLAKEEGYSRIFKLDGKKYFLCACYDSFGIKKKGIPNFGIDVVLDLVHGFYPKGEENSGDPYFAKHGVAGLSKHWGCPVFGAAVFFNRRIPERWPTGVIWNKGDKNTKKWRYNDNPMKPAAEFEWEIKEGEALVRIYEI